MIHRIKTPDGKDSYRAYAIRDTGEEHGHVLRFVGAFDTAEAAKDRLQAELAEQVETFTRKVLAFRMMLDAPGWAGLHCDEWNVEIIRKEAHDLWNDSYFLGDTSSSLFGEGCSADGMVALHGDAAIAYAAKHGMQVRYAELARGNFKDGYPELLSPGAAKERMPEASDRWIWVDVPHDTITPDLPPNLSWRDLDRKENERPRTPAELRESAARFRDWAKEQLGHAQALEERAAAAEVAK